jgi:hypothetical protein
MKTYWMSFCDGERPEGQQFLGVAVIDVTVEEAADELSDLNVRFPNHAEGAEWIAAAARKAWRLGCNPGGQVMNCELSREWPGYDSCPRGVLMTRERLAELELV